jgi:hypothetical protein
MVEIAISLAIIGIALVSIIGVLPIGMNTQRDNREETIINQDATILMEALRGGARGLDDLTNYVYAVTNYWTLYNPGGSVNGSNKNGYVYSSFSVAPGYYYPPARGVPLTNGLVIIGLLSTPLYTDNNGLPVPNLLNGGYSNRVVAYIRSLSGLAVEKPPQTNDTLLENSFSYRILCVNAPVAMRQPPQWQSGQAYIAGDTVSIFTNGQTLYMQATTNSTGAWPGDSFYWRWFSYPQQLDANLRELRVTFYWPLLPNGQVGPGRQTFRTLVTGQLAITNLAGGPSLYFYQPQSFLTVTNAL